MATDIFHQAARDGYLEILKEATRRDCDRPDEDGMTPTLWAAFHGNLDALRLLASRGGNPNKCDHFGSTALHHAASNGHLNCVSFLVSFGANIWAMDNQFHTAIDLAAMNNRNQIVQFLDRTITQQIQVNKKVVHRMKERAMADAEKRAQRYAKLQSKAQKEALKEEKRLQKEREKMGYSDMESVPSLPRRDKFYRNTRGSGRSHSASTFSEPKPYSAHFTINSKSGKKFMTGVAKKLRQRSIKSEPTGCSSDFKISDTEVDGTKTIRSLAGFRRDPHIMYVRGNSTVSQETDPCIGAPHGDESSVSRAISEPDLTYMVSNADSGIDSDSSPPEYTIPSGFGTIAFMNRRLTNGLLMSFPSQEEEVEENGDSAIGSPNSKGSKPSSRKRRTSATDSIGTIGSLVQRMRELPWEEEDLLLDDDDIQPSSPLELFLASNGLTEFISLFTREKIDMDALMLVTEVDLKALGLPLGPKLKLMDAIRRRKEALNRPGVLEDSVL